MIRLRERARLRRAAPRESPHAHVPVGTDFAREVAPGELAVEECSVTRLLYERLGESTVAEVEQRVAELPDGQSSALDTTHPDARRAFVLNWGMWLGIPSVAEKTGLWPAQPPDDVHAMSRGPLAAAGGLGEADFVVDGLRSAGVRIDQVRSGLDFGCSSGRVVRVLAAAYPQARWLGCDPNEAAIAWAGTNLPGIEFFANSQQPPLGLEDASLDLVLAISIWSHFAPSLGVRWFDEMHRVIRPGGHLVFTTHGLQSVAFFAVGGLRPAEQADEIRRALYSRGWWYAPEFGARGDWGVVNPDWGTAFLSSEWLLRTLCPRWRVLEFAPGRNQGNQDVLVLERA